LHCQQKQVQISQDATGLLISAHNRGNTMWAYYS